MTAIRIITTKLGINPRLIPYNKLIQKEIHKQAGLISSESFIINRTGGNFSMENLGINHTNFQTRIQITDWNSFSEWENWEQKKIKIQSNFKDGIFKENHQVLIKDDNYINNIFLL